VFSTTTNQEREEILNLMKDLKDEKGKSIDETKILHTLDIDQSKGTVNIKLNLTQDYRKAKALLQERI
jgi:hypothetical protein